MFYNHFVVGDFLKIHCNTILYYWHELIGIDASINSDHVNNFRRGSKPESLGTYNCLDKNQKKLLENLTPLESACLT